MNMIFYTIMAGLALIASALLMTAFENLRKKGIQRDIHERVQRRKNYLNLEAMRNGKSGIPGFIDHYPSGTTTPVYISARPVVKWPNYTFKSILKK